MSWFTSAYDADRRLASVGYMADDQTAMAVHLAGVLRKPLLAEGPAGVGKTELAKAIARSMDAELIRLQCYEGLDEARALYEWNYKKQLLYIQVEAAAKDTLFTRHRTHDEWEETLFSEDFLLPRPLLQAIRRTEPTVLLIDEIDKADVELEGLLLEILSDFQVTIPELGTVVAANHPFVVLTSNAARELSEALRRRCLYTHVDYPTRERERKILLSQVPGLEDSLAGQIVAAVATLRSMELRKSPSIAEAIDWARTLVALGADTIDEAVIAITMGVLLKHNSDHERALKEIGFAGG